MIHLADPALWNAKNGTKPGKITGCTTDTSLYDKIGEVDYRKHLKSFQEDRKKRMSDLIEKKYGISKDKFDVIFEGED